MGIHFSAYRYINKIGAYYVNIPLHKNHKLSYPINTAKGQLRNVESAVVNMASSYFLLYHAPRDTRHIYL